MRYTSAAVEEKGNHMHIRMSMDEAHEWPAITAREDEDISELGYAQQDWANYLIETGRAYQ